MSPEDRDKILDILCQCGTTIKEGISFEMNFTKKGHSAAADKIDSLEAMLRHQYRIALQLIYEIRHSCKSMQDEYESLAQKSNDWFKVRGRNLWRQLTNVPLAWDSNAKAIARLKSEWTVEKKSLEDEIAYDENTVKVRVWIKEKDDSEPQIATLAEIVMPENKYGNAADWLILEDDKFKNWCGLLQVPAGQCAAQSTQLTPNQAAKRVLWLRGGPGTGKTTLLYHAYHALRDNPEMQPIGMELRVIRYFCDAKKMGTKPPSSETIIRALTWRLSLLPDFTLADATQKRYNKFISSPGSHDDLDIKKLFKKLITSGADQYRFVFLIDALDECIDSEQLADFLTFMSTVLESAANVYLLCSSHKYVNVGTFFGAGNTYVREDILEVVDVTAAKSAAGMKEFIPGELERRKEKANASIFCKWRAGFLYFQKTS